MKKLLSLLLLLLIVSPSVFAGPFDPPPTDQSVSLLGVIFGSNVGDIPLGGSPNPVLSDLMEKFNFMIVVVGLIVVSYVGVLSVINTANEGTAMGKKWSAVWIPMRSIAGMALMVPAPASGYSMIQVTVMWIILQGIGAADALWDIALEGLASGASASTGAIISKDLMSEGTAIAKQLLNAKTCMSTLYNQAITDENQNANNGTGSWLARNGQLVGDFARVDESNPTYTLVTNSSYNVPAYCTPVDGKQVYYAGMKGTLYFGVDNSSSDDNKVCGSMTVSGGVCSTEFAEITDQVPSENELKQIAQNIYYTKILAISSMLTSLQPLAEGFAGGDYVQPVFSTDVDTKEPPPGYIKQAATQYQNTLNSLVVQPIGGSGFASGISDKVKRQIELGKQNGWITAGSFYFIFNKSAVEGTLFKSISSPDEVVKEKDTIPNCSGNLCGNYQEKINYPIRNLLTFDADKNALGTKLAYADAYVTANKASATSSIFQAPGSSAEGPSEVLGIANQANAQAIANMTAFFNNDDPNTDPLLGMSLFGQSLMLGVEGTIIAILSLAFVLGSGAIVPDAIYGIPIPWPRFGSFASQLALNILVMLAVFLPMFAVMWAFGGMLAVYVPLIPYMIFTLTALGWILIVVESVIAAPIVALGFVLPSGDDLGKIEHALSLLANIFLRPMLMLFGFILGARVFKAIVMLINMGMGSVYNSINISTMFSTIMVIGVYTTFIITVANTCFSLIYAVPDKILRWIGGAAEHTDTTAVGEAKGAAQKTGQEVGAGLGEIGAKGANKIEGAATSNKQANAADKMSNAADKMSSAADKMSKGSDKPKDS